MHPSIKIITAPTKEPWQVGGAGAQGLDILQHLSGLDPNPSVEEKAYLEGLIRTARLWAENFTSRRFITQTLDLCFADGFPYSEKFVSRCDEIRISVAPVASITHVKYLDTAGAQQTLVVTTDYDSVTGVGVEPAVVVPAYGRSWPAVRQHFTSGKFPVEVRIVAGYGNDGTSVPMNFRAAMALLVGHWFNNREAVSDVALSELPTYGVEALLSQDRFFPW